MFIKKFILILAFILAFTGCSSTDISEEKAVISFVDDENREINLDTPAERIISFYSAHTENIYYLGAGNRLIGAYKTCTYPPEAAFLERFDYNGDPEAVIAANPDVVIIRPFINKKVPEYVKAIENAGIKVVSLYCDSFDGFDDYIRKLALLTGTENRAEELLLDFHNEINSINAITEKAENKQSIFFESTETNIRTVTANSMAGVAIELAGGENIAKDAKPTEDGSSIAEFGEERVLMNADNIDVYVSQRGSMNSGASEQGISERAGFDSIKAIKDGRFFTINEKIISSASFRYVTGVRELARYLYPDLMDSVEAYSNDDIATKRSCANIIFNKLHLPVSLPSSSSYYESEHKGHSFGLFEDVSWQDSDFNAVEAVVERGYMEGEKKDNKEYFYPQNNVTRDELAQSIFVMGDFSSKDTNIAIADIDKCSNKRIVQILVDNGVFELNNGMFEPERQVTNNEIIRALEFVV